MNLKKLTGTISLLLGTSLFTLPAEAAQKQITHTYGGVHRCGYQQSLAEAEKAAKNYVNQLSNNFGIKVTLRNHKMVRQATRHWEERSYGISKGRKCEGTVVVDVVYDAEI